MSSEFQEEIKPQNRRKKAEMVILCCGGAGVLLLQYDAFVDLKVSYKVQVRIKMLFCHPKDLMLARISPTHRHHHWQQ